MMVPSPRLAIGRSMHPHHRIGKAIAPCLMALLAAFLIVAAPASAQIPAGHSPFGLEATPAASPVAETPLAGAALESVLPGERSAVQAQMPAGMTEYTIDATLVANSSVDGVRGQESVRFTNTTGQDLRDVPFRLYANGKDGGDPDLTVNTVTVDDQSVSPTLSVGNSVLTVPFAEPLAPNASVRIDLEFNATLPVDTAEHYGIFGVDTETGTWALAHWYPLVAGRDPETGWMLDSPSVNGDPIYSDIALYDVTMTSPVGWKIVTSGEATTEPSSGPDGMVSQHFVAGPVRDFTVVADADFEVVSQEANGITFNSWYNPGEEAAAEAVNTYGMQSIALFSDLISPYPYTEIDFMPVDMKGAAGCEFPGLIYVGHSYYPNFVETGTDASLEFTVAHEVVHQWFYGLIGNDQYAHAFIDEGITNYLSADVYFEHTYDSGKADDMMARYIKGPYDDALDGGVDPVVDTPTDSFDSGYAYEIAAYQKAPMGFQAIHDEIGDDAFFRGLQQYATAWTFRIATPDDMLAAFESASGEDLGALWNYWFEEQQGDS